MAAVDVFVIGGGPAGLATAIAARRRGMSVIVADGQRGPIDKACGEGLLPDALATARRIGLSIPSHCGAEIRGVHFLRGDHVVKAVFGFGPGLGVRRTLLHTLLMSQAGAEGSCIRQGLIVTKVEGARVFAGEESFDAKWVVVADGGRSRFRTLVSTDAQPRRVRYAFRQHFAVEPWNDAVEVHWGEREQIYVTPVAPTEVGVAFISDSPSQRLAQVLPRFSCLAARLAGVPSSSAERGLATTTLRLGRVTQGRVLLIGDASGSVDAITGEGIGLAFRQAEAVVDAIARDDPQRYEAEHRRIMREPRAMGELLLAMGSSAGMTNSVMRLLGAQPWLFQRLVTLHAGA